MTLSSVCIKKPVLAIVLSIVLVIFGIVGLVNLEVREYPNVDAPIITVTTNFPGANSDVIESQITEPLEQSINGIDGISIMSSTSREQRSQISVEFDLDKDIDAAANDVRDRVSRVLRQLPPDIEIPSVEKADADASPIIIVFVSSNSKNVLEVNNFAANVIAEKIQTIKGVSSTRIFGERKYSMRLRFNPDKLNSYNMTPLDVEKVLVKENIELPSGRIEGDNTELTIKTFGRLSKPEEFNNLIIKNVDGSVVRLSDVGNAEYGPENERNEVRGYGLPGVAVAILPQPGANVLQISDEFNKRFAEIKKDLPEGPTFYPTDHMTDQTERTIVGEIVREKVLMYIDDEIPHGVAVEVQSMKKRINENKIEIYDLEVDIICEKASHKGIIIGKEGRKLKGIGKSARQDIETLLQTKVNLQLFVKVREGWRDNTNFLKNLGYKE